LYDIIFTFDLTIGNSPMKNFTKVILLTLFIIVASNYKASAGPVVTGKDNDTSSLKSNILIFNMISGSAAPAPANKAKTLKKAGSVARTSNSHSDASPKPLPGES